MHVCSSGCSYCCSSIFEERGNFRIFRITNLNRRFDIGTVNTNRNTHQHVLWSLGNLAVQFKQVAAFECLEAKVIVLQIALVENGRVQLVLVVHNDLVSFLANERCVFSIRLVRAISQVGDHFGKAFLCLLMQIRHGDASGQCAKVGMFNRHLRTRLGRQIVKLDRADAVVDTF